MVWKFGAIVEKTLTCKQNIYGDDSIECKQSSKDLLVNLSFTTWLTSRLIDLIIVMDKNTRSWYYCAKKTITCNLELQVVYLCWSPYSSVIVSSFANVETLFNFILACLRDVSARRLGLFCPVIVIPGLNSQSWDLGLRNFLSRDTGILFQDYTQIGLPNELIPCVGCSGPQTVGSDCNSQNTYYIALQGVGLQHS